MDIGQLELLDVLVQQRSFKKAARQCFVTTSTLARQVTAMEAELGFPIFTRSAHGIVLFRNNSPVSDWTVENLVRNGILDNEKGEKLARCRIATP